MVEGICPRGFQTLSLGLGELSHGIQEASFHLVLLAKDEIGYKNLMKLVSIGYTEGFYYRPRIDKEVLAKYNDGLIGLSACLKGEVPHLLLSGEIDNARRCADQFRYIVQNTCPTTLAQQGNGRQRERTQRE